MHKYGVKKIAKGILRIYAAEIFFDELHTFQYRSSLTYRIVSSNMNFVSGELRAVKLKKT